MSIRLRLTVLYSIIVALTLVAFSTAVYAVTARVSMDAVEQTLVAEAQRLADRPHPESNYSGYYPGYFEGEFRGFAGPETYAQIRNADGAIAAKTQNLGEFDLPISDGALHTCQGGHGTLEVISTDNGRLIVYNRPVAAHGQIIGIVQVARSLADYDQSLNTLGRILGIGSLAVTGVAFGFGWLMAGAALRPIHHITETAQAIGAERDFGRRVEYGGPRDEVHWLARTFNAMLTELQGAYRQSEDALLAQRRFAADASHELRTPLTTIRGNLGLLQRQPPIAADDREAVVGDLVEETERLMRLVNSLLLLARADAKRALRQEPVPVAPLVEEVCRQVKLLAPGRTITCDTPQEVVVAGDRDALKQVLLILLDNALRHTPEPAAIEVSASSAGDRAVLRVRDEGPGIPEDVLPHIFDRFYRADSARTAGGAGLGLAIARALVEALNGTLTVESRPGQGSVFTIQLNGASAPED